MRRIQSLSLEILLKLSEECRQHDTSHQTYHLSLINDYHLFHLNNFFISAATSITTLIIIIIILSDWFSSSLTRLIQVVIVE